MATALGMVILFIAVISLANGRETDPFNYDIEDYSNHPCNRQCSNFGLPRVCKYNFLVENYYVLSKACYDCPFNQSHCSLPHCVAADGVQRAIKTANRMMPGPSIQVCQGDIIEVTVDNKMESSEGTSIHWHGILQKGSQHMDGVAMVTQCPISYHSKFTYRFRAENPGTHYWHSHAGVQRSDGLYGPLVVRRPPVFEPHRNLYDYDLPDHVIMLSDWIVDLTTQRLARYVHFDYNKEPRLMLINGKGYYQQFQDPVTNQTFSTPRASFTVRPGKKYRFRVINSVIMNCPIQFSIDGHQMTVISSDGNPFHPFVTDSFTSYSGERFDFVLYADKTTTLRNYWIRTRGYNNCAKHKATQTAILKYQGAADVLPVETTTWEDGERGGISLNPALVLYSPTSKEITEMTAVDPDDDILTSLPDKKFYMAIDFVAIENERAHNSMYYPFNASKKFYSPQINWISNQLPGSPPLTQLSDIPPDVFCNAENVQKNCKEQWCACVHLYKVALGDLVEVIIVDEGKPSHAYHPMHLHGYKFRVVGMDRLGTSTTLDTVKGMDQRGELKRLTTKAPLKDTVIVPDGGYTIIRFRADNPGFWIFHCHVEFHSETGMAMLFQVGTASQLPPKPKNFHTCGDWHFSGYETEGGNSNNNYVCNILMKLLFRYGFHQPGIPFSETQLQGPPSNQHDLPGINDLPAEFNIPGQGEFINSPHQFHQESANKDQDPTKLKGPHKKHKKQVAPAENVTGESESGISVPIWG